MIQVTIHTGKKIIVEEKSNGNPTPRDLEKFCARFDRYEWQRLTENHVFNDLIMEDLKKAEEYAEKYLKSKPRQIIKVS